MLDKKHLTWEGLLQIIAYKSHFPKGLSNLLINSFPNYKPVILPDYTPNLNIININWIAGFINSDGDSFYMFVKKRNSCIRWNLYTIYYYYNNNRSIIVLEYIKTFFLVWSNIL